MSAILEDKGSEREEIGTIRVLEGGVVAEVAQVEEKICSNKSVCFGWNKGRS